MKYQFLIMPVVLLGLAACASPTPTPTLTATSAPVATAEPTQMPTLTAAATASPTSTPAVSPTFTLTPLPPTDTATAIDTPAPVPTPTRVFTDVQWLDLSAGGPASDLAFSPDGQQMVVGAMGGIYIYDTQTWQQQISFDAPQRAPLIADRLAYSPDGKTVASASSSLVVFWDAGYGEAKHFLTIELPGDAAIIRGLAYSPDGRLLAIGSAQGFLRVFNTSNSQAAYDLAGHTNTVNAVAFSPDGGLVASGAADGTVKFWDAATGKGQRTLNLLYPVQNLAFAPDGQTLAVGTTKTVTLWDVATGTKVRTFAANSEGSNAVAFSPDGRWLGSGTTGKVIEVWDAATGAEIRSLPVGADLVSHLAFSLDGTTLAFVTRSLTGDGQAGLWRLATAPTGLTPTPTPTPAAWQYSTTNVLAFAPDGKTLALGGGDGGVHLIDPATGQAVRQWAAHPRGIQALAFSPDGSRLVSGSRDTTIRLWDPATGQLQDTLAGHTNTVQGLAFTPDGASLVSASADGTALVWDLAQKAVRLTLTADNAGAAWSVAVSPDGKTIATGHGDSRIRLWDAATGVLQGTLSGHTGPVWSVAFSPDGNLLASGSSDGDVRLWKTDSSGTTLRVLTGHTGIVFNVAFSGDGRRVASAGDDGTVRLWQVEYGQALETLSGHTGSVTGVVFSPVDSRLLISSGADKAVRVWNLSVVAPKPTAASKPPTATPRPTETTVAMPTLGPTPQSVKAAHTLPAATWSHPAWSSDGARLAVPQAQGVTIYDTTTYAPLATIPWTPGHLALDSIWFDAKGQLMIDGDTARQTFNAQTGQLLVTTPIRSLDESGLSPAEYKVAVSPDHRLVAFAGWSMPKTPTIFVWARDAGQRVYQYKDFYGHLINSLVFSPDGRWLAFGYSGYVSEDVVIWRMDTGESSSWLSPGAEALLTDDPLAVSMDGHYLATRNDFVDRPEGFGAVQVWDLWVTPTQPRWFEGWEPELSFTQLSAVAFSPDGKLLAADVDGKPFVLVWDVASGHRLYLLASDTTVRDLVFSPDGHQLAGVSNQTLIWSLP